jgi:hypothetical protein
LNNIANKPKPDWGRIENQKPGNMKKEGRKRTKRMKRECTTEE